MNQRNTFNEYGVTKGVNSGNEIEVFDVKLDSLSHQIDVLHVKMDRLSDQLNGLL